MHGMDAKLQKNMDVYVNKIRPQFATAGEQKLFIKDDGEAFPEGTIGKHVSAFFKKSGVTNTHIARTTLRKFITTQTYQHGNSREDEDVQKVMGHSKTLLSTPGSDKSSVSGNESNCSCDQAPR